MIKLPLEIKKLCDNMIEENKFFYDEDALYFCRNSLKNLDLNYFEYTEALLYVLIGLEQEGEDHARSLE